MTPMERVEALFGELVGHYHEARDAELRAAIKLLLVAIAELKQHGGSDWAGVVADYVAIAERDPQRFDRILRSNRSDPSLPMIDDTFTC